jgi:hypothetical protein
MRKLRSLANALLGTLGAMTLVVAIPATAHANVLTLLPQNANGLEQTYSPAYDYDSDGCYATAAVSMTWARDGNTFSTSTWWVSASGSATPSDRTRTR